MIGERGLSRRWRRLIVVFCTLLLAGSTMLILGVAVWAQEQPAGTEAQPTQQQQKQGLTIDYWEPKVGDKTVYLIDDINDVHGAFWGTSMLGYWDIFELFVDTLDREMYDSYGDPVNMPYQVVSSYYWSVDAPLSNMNPVYFDLVGPWYFWLTTPYKVIEEVIDIGQTADAAKFPEATYAYRVEVIGSGGQRYVLVDYCSNDAAQKEWLEWGYTVEYFPSGRTTVKKDMVHYRNPSNRKVSMPVRTPVQLSVGSTGSHPSVYLEGGNLNHNSESATYEVVAEGKITVPGGTFDALMIRYIETIPQDRKKDPQIVYAWVVQNTGMVTQIRSLPNEIGPLFDEATEMYVLQSFAAAGGGEQKK